MCKMLCRDNVPVAKTDIAAADLHRQDRLGAGESCKHLGKQGGKLLLGKGLHEIVERIAYRKNSAFAAAFTVTECTEVLQAI